MARKVSEIIKKATEDLNKAIAEYGPDTAGKLIRKSYPEIPNPTWQALLKKVGITTNKKALDVAKKTAKHLPAPVSPSYISKKPNQARKAIDLLWHIEDMLDDVMRLRDYAMPLALSDKGNEELIVEHPSILAAAIKLRNDVIVGAVKINQQLYDHNRLEKMYKVYRDAITEADPATGLKISKALAQIDAEYGFTNNGS